MGFTVASIPVFITSFCYMLCASYLELYVVVEL